MNAKKLDELVQSFHTGDIVEIRIREKAFESGKVQFFDESQKRYMEQGRIRTFLGYVRRTTQTHLSLMTTFFIYCEPTIVIAWDAIKDYTIYAYSKINKKETYAIKTKTGIASGLLKRRH